MLKISILTATYNRANLLPNLYNSLKTNKREDICLEWLIMDDGSTDDTKDVVQSFNTYDNLEIKYFFQENSGKMTAINNLVPKATGDLIVDCDSDDYFAKNAFEEIKKAYEESKDEKDIYALCFLKYDTKGNNLGKNFKKTKTTMFDLYFKELEDGEKALVFFGDIRKQYKYKLEKNEKFGTESRMYHEMDLKYKIKCYNKPIMISEYQEDGYTKNIQGVFKNNPFGYYKYFQEILQRDMKGVNFKKRLYVIKHFILFSYLTKQYDFKHIEGILNKILLYLLFLPGIIKSSRF